MYAMTSFPNRLHWDSFQLAEAVPRRLSELYHFDARDHVPATAPAKGTPRRHARAAAAYAPASDLPALFRVD